MGAEHPQHTDAALLDHLVGGGAAAALQQAPARWVIGTGAGAWAAKQVAYELQNGYGSLSCMDGCIANPQHTCELSMTPWPLSADSACTTSLGR